jgi:hypothetical protein
MTPQPYNPKGRGIKSPSDVMSPIMIGISIVDQYNQSLGFDPLGYVTKLFSARDSQASLTAFIDEICSKYEIGGMQRPLECQIVHARIGNASPAIYLNTRVALPLSFTLAPTIDLRSLLWHPKVERAETIKERLPELRLELGVLSKTERQHLQTVVSLPTMADEQLPRITGSLGKGERDAQVDSHERLERIGMPNRPMGRTSLAPQNTGRPLYVLNADTQRQRLRHVIGTGRVRSAVALDHPQQEHLGPIAPLRSLTAAVSAERTRRDLMTTSHDIDRAPVGTSRYPGFQPGVLAHVHGLATNSTKQTDFIPVQTSLSHSVRQAEQLPPKERQTVERWQPIADAWLLPNRQQRFGVSTIDVWESSTSDGVIQDLRLLTVLRKEARLQSPPLHYTYVPPTRPIAQEEQIVTGIHEKEVARAVKKEVQALMASGSIMKYFSRADYSHIAENVYSSLVRQVLVEKERIGVR